MLKCMFFGVPSTSVNNTLVPIINQIAKEVRVLFYNAEGYLPQSSSYHFTVVSYPDDFNGYYAEKIDSNTSYFQFAEILIDSATVLMDFLMKEIEREKPDFILHSHLAMWGKLIAKRYSLPSITCFTTFVLDKRIMLPFFRRIKDGTETNLSIIGDALGFYRKSLDLYRRINVMEICGMPTSIKAI
jgi:hypothetical protein